jgi:hypothetical protein
VLLTLVLAPVWLPWRWQNFLDNVTARRKPFRMASTKPRLQRGCKGAEVDFSGLFEALGTLPNLSFLCCIVLQFCSFCSVPVSHSQFFHSIISLLATVHVFQAFLGAGGLAVD